MEKNKISVCIATFNGEKYIKEQLLSIVNQLPHEYDEIIVSDDSSTDKTVEKIKEINDKRIVIYNSTAKNVIQNFENALNKANGDFIFLADQDDIWLDNKIEQMMEGLQQNLLVFTNLIVFCDKTTSDKGILLYPIEENQSGFFKNFVKNRYTGAVMAFRKELLKYALPFPKNIAMHDVWLGLLAEYYGEVLYLKRPFIFYRRHENNLSETGSKSSNKIYQKLIIRFNLLWSLLKRIWLNR